MNTLTLPGFEDEPALTDLPPTADAIHQGDCIKLLGGLEAETVDLAFADPPFNIGFKYDEYHDDHADDDYLAWCEAWMAEIYRVIKPSGAFWLAIGDEYAAELKIAAKRLGFSPRNWIVWYYTFGQNCTRKFNRSHAHLFHFVKDEKSHTFNAQDPQVRVPSARALVYGDKRANPKGRLPDDTWILRPQDLRDEEYAFRQMDDTWYFSRVAGTFKERQGFHGCQMPEQLLGRIVRVSSNEGDLVLDPFAGSGTTLAVAKKLGRHWLGLELSKDYVKYGNERLDGCQSGDPLNGPADPMRSSPTTAKGRKLKGHPLVKGEDGKGKEGEVFVKSPPPEPVSASVAGVEDDPALTVSHAPSALPLPPSPLSLRDLTRTAIIDAFLSTHEGHSIDWLLCDPDRQQAFHTACAEAGLIGRPSDWNHELLRLRKSGKMPKLKLQISTISADDIDQCAHAAEIAWAESQRKYPGTALDELFSSPSKGFFFDRTVGKHLGKKHAEVSAAVARWAALRQRKARHSLADEAKEYDYVLATRDFGRLPSLGTNACRSPRRHGGPVSVAVR